jgi:hypothetical protein
MLRFFFTKYAFKLPAISDAALQEATQALKEIEKLGASTKYDELVSALVLVSETERKYPFFQGNAFYCRSKIGTAMTKHPDFIRKLNADVNPSPKP